MALTQKRRIEIVEREQLQSGLFSEKMVSPHITTCPHEGLVEIADYKYRQLKKEGRIRIVKDDNKQDQLLILDSLYHKLYGLVTEGSLAAKAVEVARERGDKVYSLYPRAKPNLREKRKSGYKPGG